MSNLFENAEVISSYSEEQAVDDGALVVMLEAYPSLLVTCNVAGKLSEVREQRGCKINQVVGPLFADADMAIRADRNPADGFHKLHNTAVGTVWIFPNERRGFTLMAPEDY